MLYCVHISNSPRHLGTLTWKKDILKLEAVQRRAARCVKKSTIVHQVPSHPSIATLNGIPLKNDAKYSALLSSIRHSTAMSVWCYLHTSTPKQDTRAVQCEAGSPVSEHRVNHTSKRIEEVEVLIKYFLFGRCFNWKYVVIFHFETSRVRGRNRYVNCIICWYFISYLFIYCSVI